MTDRFIMIREDGSQKDVTAFVEKMIDGMTKMAKELLAKEAEIERLKEHQGEDK